MGKPLRLLHLSDLHLGDITTRFLDSAKYDVPTEVRSTAETAFSRGLSDARLRSVDKMFVSGDITIAGGASGFTEFERFIHTRVLRPGLVRSPSDICVVPGNHDVEWNLTGVDRYRRRFDLFSSTVERLGVSTCLLPVSEDRDLGLMFDDSSFLRPIHVDHERSLLILCLNSAVRCGEVDVRRRELLEKGLMREDAGLRTTLERDLTVHDIASVTSAQLDRVVGSLQVMRSNLEDWDALFKVATLHHHLVPFSGQATEHKPFDAIVDAGPLLKRLDEFGFHLVLSGHKHQDYAVVHFGDSARTMLIAGAPTLAGYAVDGGRGFRDLEVERQGDSFAITMTTRVFKGETVSSSERKTHVVGASQSLCQRAVLHFHHAYQSSAKPLPHPPGVHIALLNITGVSNRYDDVGKRLRAIAQDCTGGPITIDAVFDLYGSSDFLVRLRANANADIPDFLEHHVAEFYRGEDCWVERVLQPRPNEPMRGGCSFVDRSLTRIDPTQIRAFIRIKGRPRSQWLDLFSNAILQAERNCGQGRVVLAGIYVFQDSQVIADCVASCGAFYALSDVLSAVELGLTDAEKQETLIVKRMYER